MGYQVNFRSYIQLVIYFYLSNYTLHMYECMQWKHRCCDLGHSNKIYSKGYESPDCKSLEIMDDRREGKYIIQNCVTINDSYNQFFFKMCSDSYENIIECLDFSQVGGWVQEYNGLTFVVVRGAGHEIPKNKPKEALTVFKSFLAGKAPQVHSIPVSPTS